MDPSDELAGTAREIDDSTKVHGQLNSYSYSFPDLKELNPQDLTFSGNDPISKYCRQIFQDGYVVVPDMLTSQQVKDLRDISTPHLDKTPVGRNAFEGTTTRRFYGLITKHERYRELLLLPVLQEILDKLLYKNYLLTAFLGIEIAPKEKQQLLHFDDQYVYMPRPRPYTGVAVIWAIDPFTEENGATRVIPGSHLWSGDRLPTKDDKLIPIEMKPGSGLLLLSTTWHGGGPNNSSMKRLGITAQFCQPWIRPQENQFLSVSFDQVMKLDPKIQSLLGYSIHFPFIGHSNGLHPLKAIKHKL